MVMSSASSSAEEYHAELLDVEEKLNNMLLPYLGIANSNNNNNNSSNGKVLFNDAMNEDAEYLIRKANRMLHQLRVQVRVLDPIEHGEQLVALYTGYVDAHVRAITQLRTGIQQARRESQEAAQRRHVYNAQHTTNGNNNNASLDNRDADHDDEEDERAPLIGKGAGTSSFSVSASAAAAEASEEASAMMDAVRHTQGLTLKSLRHTERVLDETETIGQHAGKELRRQTEQIVDVNRELTEMRSDIARAGEELRAFARRMARDRIVIFFAIANILCIIAVLLWSVVKRWMKT